MNRSEITSYNLEASDDAGNTWTETVDYTGDRTSLRYTMHRGLEPATAYSYRIAAVIDRISRRWSAVVDATTEPAATVYDPIQDVPRCAASEAPQCIPCAFRE